VGFLYFVSQHLQLVEELSPLDAALALVPGLGAMILSGLLVVPVAKRFPPRVVVPIALALSATAYVMIAVGASELALLVLAFALLGIGIGAAETVSNELVLASAPSAKAGAASAVSETAYELGAVLGTAVLGGILTALYRAHLVVPPGVPDAAADAARETLAGAAHAADQLAPATGEALHAAAATAFDSGAVLTALIGAGLVVLAGIVAATTLGGTRSASH
jgi:MFS transporter, DHA2 family, multidrug resistance protein